MTRTFVGDEELCFTKDEVASILAQEGEERCPNPETIVDLADGRLEEESAAVVRQHLLNCDSCREEYHLLAAAAPVAAHT